jgi:Trk-type K+ transport system membrane component
MLQQPFSLSGEMRTIPKLVIIGLMIRGRHRGLPMAIDRAVSKVRRKSISQR